MFMNLLMVFDILDETLSEGVDFFGEPRVLKLKAVFQLGKWKKLMVISIRSFVEVLERILHEEQEDLVKIQG